MNRLSLGTVFPSASSLVSCTARWSSGRSAALSLVG